MKSTLPYNPDKITFTEHDEYTIRRVARGMTLAEVFELYGFGANDLSIDDNEFFMYNYRKGRLDGVDTAVTELFKHMQQKGGAGVAMSYLIRFAKDWPALEEADNDIAGKKSFKITFDG